ncbi:hypothetical protein QR77_23820 [Streptomyces sp. 150FB]|uniref:hypothetical protein n=1 Tax=Streptomyces sp. 150FB TaxID=1576605 RepID=UPI00058933E7|nr:hypothetical protein [Streptomyces sp. 150FB]KIF76091.1 hypothetical protein QR77_23820 [Streptomyces sp. 150FB]
MHGIAFTGTIKAAVTSPFPHPITADDIIDSVRATLRDVAKDVARSCDPTDLASARDLCARHVRTPRDLPTEPPIGYQSQLLTLTLSLADQAAVNTLLGAQRDQAVKETLRAQRQQALITGLAEPAAVLAHWLEATGNWDKLPDKDSVDLISKAFSEHHPGRQEPVEYALIEVVRDFLSTFDAPEQKRMLVTLLAGGMSQAQRPLHAARATTLLNGQCPQNPREST